MSLDKAIASGNAQRQLLPVQAPSGKLPKVSEAPTAQMLVRSNARYVGGQICTEERSVMKLACACGNIVDVREGCVRVTCARCITRAMANCAPKPMQPLRPTTPIRALVVHECANSVNARHLGHTPCHILAGLRCDYFEHAVLPGAKAHKGTADYMAFYMAAKGQPPEAPPIEDKPQVIFTPETGSVLKAIRRRCLDCAETIPDIVRCPFDGEKQELCALWPYRFGKNPKLAGRIFGGKPFAGKTASDSLPMAQTAHESTSSYPRQGKTESPGGRGGAALKCHPQGPRAAAHAYCTDCSGANPLEVKFCPATDCPLHPYRFGHRPKSS